MTWSYSVKPIKSLLAWRLLLPCLLLLLANASHAQTFYLLDGNFESSPGANNAWQSCQGQVDLQVIDGQGSGIFGIQLPPFEGQHYLGLSAGGGLFNEAIGQEFELIGGEFYAGSIAAFQSDAHQSWTGSAHLEIWGGNDCHSLNELLWSSPSIANVNQWQQLEFGFAPLQSHRWLSLVAVLDQGSNGMAYLCVDDLQLVYSVLEFDFQSLSAAQVQGGIDVQWSTAALNNATRFELQGRQIGQPFLKMGEITGLVGESEFEMHVPMPPSPGMELRMVAVNENGARQYSEIVQVAATLEQGLLAWPIPSNGPLFVLLPSELGSTAKLELFDLTGRCVLSKEIETGYPAKLQLDAELSEGQYLLVASGKGKRQVKKVLFARD